MLDKEEEEDMEVHGKWSYYRGYHLKAVAEEGFQPWTKRDILALPTLIQLGNLQLFSLADSPCYASDSVACFL
jgi:3-methyladenine DNA glycosylase AlkC